MIFYVASIIDLQRLMYTFIYVCYCLTSSYLPIFLTFCHLSSCRVVMLQPDHDRQRSQLIFSSCALQKLPKRLQDKQGTYHFSSSWTTQKTATHQNRHFLAINSTTPDHSHQPTPPTISDSFPYPKHRAIRSIFSFGLTGVAGFPAWQAGKLHTLTGCRKSGEVDSPGWIYPQKNGKGWGTKGKGNSSFEANVEFF